MLSNVMMSILHKWKIKLNILTNKIALLFQMELSFYLKLFLALLPYSDLSFSLCVRIRFCALKLEMLKMDPHSKEFNFFQITFMFYDLLLNILMITETSKKNSYNCTLKNSQALALQFHRCMLCSILKKFILIIQLCRGSIIRLNNILVGKGWQLLVLRRRAIW